ncbi:P-type conjugative transfer protein TrbL [Luteibacter sp. Lutesp34]|uniref:P-type conjugative transfer protein TrbL n=1 Tax=Luteibacter sp. Lutesp34 TaxID=3243030 RepID=UPI0039B443D2
MPHFYRCRATIVAVLCLLAWPALAADPVDSTAAVSDVLGRFAAIPFDDAILDAAKSLFWTLAAISLVWTMGLLIVRQDIGELLMELVRFTIVTGLFYWVLVNASSHTGGESFVEDIVHSFMQMVNGSQGDETVRGNADAVLVRALHVYASVVNDTGDGELPDQLLLGGMAIALLCICTVMAGQALLALVMAWMLGYASIFLLGFGGARWTSPIAVSFYKHVVAVGAALLALSVIGSVAKQILDEFGMEPSGRVYGRFATMGLMLAISILLMLLSIKVPQLIYTLVTGSTLGFFAGSASAAGTAIATGGSSAYAAATGRLPGGRDSLSPSGGSGGASAYRTDSVMDAVQRAAVATGGMADPFHTTSGSDAFGVPRAVDPHRGSGRGKSVFGNSHDTTAATTSHGGVSSEALMTTPVAVPRSGETITAQGGTRGERVSGQAQPNVSTRAATDKALAETHPEATSATGTTWLDAASERHGSAEAFRTISPVVVESIERDGFIVDAARIDRTSTDDLGRVDAPSHEAGTRVPMSHHMVTGATAIDDGVPSTDVGQPTAAQDARGAQEPRRASAEAARIDRSVHVDMPDVSAHANDVAVSTGVVHGDAAFARVETDTAVMGGATHLGAAGPPGPVLDVSRVEAPNDTQVELVRADGQAHARATDAAVHTTGVAASATSVSQETSVDGAITTDKQQADVSARIDVPSREALTGEHMAASMRAEGRVTTADVGIHSTSVEPTTTAMDARNAAGPDVTPEPPPLPPGEAVSVHQEHIKPAAPDEERLVVLASETAPSMVDAIGQTDAASPATSEPEAPVERQRKVRYLPDVTPPDPPVLHDDAARAASIRREREPDEDPT